MNKRFQVNALTVFSSVPRLCCLPLTRARSFRGRLCRKCGRSLFRYSIDAADPEFDFAGEFSGTNPPACRDAPKLRTVV